MCIFSKDLYILNKGGKVNFPLEIVLERKSSGLGGFLGRTFGWLQWEASCASMHSSGTGQVSESLTGKTPGGGKREEKTEKRDRNALPAWRLPLAPLPRAARGQGSSHPSRKSCGGDSQQSCPPQPFPAPAIPCSHPQDTFGCPFPTGATKTQSRDPEQCGLSQPGLPAQIPAWQIPGRADSSGK